MDNRSPVGVCEKHTEGASGNQYTEAGGVFRFSFPQ